MRLRYRHVQQPVPAKTHNPHDAVAAFYMRAVDAGSFNGTEFLVFSNRDESRPLIGAVYFAQAGRTQTLASFATEPAMFGSDIGPNDFLTYSGPLPAQRWRYLGSSFSCCRSIATIRLTPRCAQSTPTRVLARRLRRPWRVLSKSAMAASTHADSGSHRARPGGACHPPRVLSRCANLCARHLEDLSRRATTVEVCYPRLRPSRFSYGCEPWCWSAHSERSVDH